MYTYSSSSAHLSHHPRVSKTHGSQSIKRKEISPFFRRHMFGPPPWRLNRVNEPFLLINPHLAQYPKIATTDLRVSSQPTKAKPKTTISSLFRSLNLIAPRTRDSISFDCYIQRYLLLIVLVLVALQMYAKHFPRWVCSASSAVHLP